MSSERIQALNLDSGLSLSAVDLMLLLSEERKKVAMTCIGSEVDMARGKVEKKL